MLIAINSSSANELDILMSFIDIYHLIELLSLFDEYYPHNNKKETRLRGEMSQELMASK